jgi:hypothetical protein
MKTQIKLILLALCLTACAPSTDQATSDSGAVKQTVKVQTDASGWTVEQKNIAERLKVDNTPGAIKHLYIISPYSGQVLIYSTVRGKVTSGGKRLTPNTVSSVHTTASGNYGDIGVDINGTRFGTKEVLQDDGAYGSSCEYIFWFDAQSRFHQHFFTGGQIIHVSDQPLPVKNVVINLEEAK